tara:strand:- start:185 stop:595 length:411 start_codon:yes stop_codon:yes gene_type:complete
MPVKKKKKKTVKYWKTKIDKVFHEYIRRRDVNEHGFGKCICCNKPLKYDESDAGHFMGRQYMNTRWNEDNVNIQNRKCNRFEYGNQYAYSKALGKKKAEELQALSRITVKFMDFEYQEIFDKFNDKLKELKDSQAF